MVLVALLPLMAIIWVAFSPTENIWPHLVSTSLPHYLLNTVVLMTGVGVAVFFDRSLYRLANQHLVVPRLPDF